eukprot:PhM_4_TR4314/c0_g1_i1/m.61454
MPTAETTSPEATATNTPTIDTVTHIEYRREPDLSLDAALDAFSSKTCRCVKCGSEFNVADNHLYACHGHTGTLVLDRFTTLRNVAIGVGVGAIVGTSAGVLAGALVVGKVAAATATVAAAKGTASGLTTAATISSGYTITGAATTGAATAAGATPVVGAATTGAAVGSTVGGAGGSVQSVVPKIGAYRWSCCGADQNAMLCTSRTSMHTPDPAAERRVVEARDAEAMKAAQENFV